MTILLDLRTDLKRALRSLARSRAVGVAAVLSIGLGAAAATTVFSIVDASLFRPPPFPDAREIAALYMSRTRSDGAPRNERWSWARFRALAARQHSFSRVASYSPATVAITGTDPEPANGELVSADYLPLLGVQPIAGRVFGAASDDHAGAAPAVVIGEPLWRERFGGRSDAIGRDLSVNGVRLTIIGVLPGRFRGLTGRADLWMPATMAPALTYRDYLTTNQSFISVVGRLAPHASLERARAELAALGRQLDEQLPLDDRRTDDRVSASAVSLNDARVDPSTRRPMMLLLAGAACLLLLACANVAGLLLGQAVGRRREIALQVALGASRLRVVRQLLTESALVAAGGAALGVAIAFPLTAHAGVPAAAFRGRNFYGALGEFALPRVDPRVLVFALALCAVTVMLFGVLPALHATRVDLRTAMSDGGGGSIGAGSMRLRHALVAGETALALVLLVAGGLFASSLRSLARTNVGFDPRGLVDFTIRPSEVAYPPSRAPALVARVLDEVRRVPGVVAASVDGCAPMGTTCANARLFIDGRPWASPDESPLVLRHYVGPEHFRVLGVPVVRGRAFTDDDRAGAPRVAVINEAAGKRFWPNDDPIGKRVWFGGGSSFDRPDSAATIVGVVGDVAYQPLDEHPVQPDFYTPYAQFTYATRTVLVRTRADPRATIAGLRHAVERASPELAIFDPRITADHMADTWARVTYQSRILVAFAIVAMLLAAGGIFAVIAQAIADRTREIGMRVVLGAGARQVLSAVGAHGLRPAAAGVVVGLAASVAVGRGFASFLYGVPPLDVVVLATVSGLVAVVALVTTYFGARRALSISPTEALRQS